MQRILGSYRLLEPLGEGGMGVVYLAEHRASGQRVALKTLRVPKAGLLQGIRREISSLARLRHPDIVPIVGEGIEDGVPWYAMERVQGETLRQAMLRWRQAPPRVETEAPGRTASLRIPTDGLEWQEATHDLERTASLRLASSELEWGEEGVPPAHVETTPAVGLSPSRMLQILEFARRLCSPLAFLHGEGVVHRDLKPENILLRTDGRPVLVDFGLASRFSREVSREGLELKEEGVWGTVAYIAPEQGRNEAVDARSDLYSLGCILYELLTGRPPFVAAQPIQVLYKHWTAKPQPPSQLVHGGLPEELDALVLRLLEKEPRRRFGYADDVAAALGRLGAAGAGAGTGPTPRAYLYRPGFAGRRQALLRLRELLERLRDGAGGLALVGGESGVGKTRLMVELGNQAHAWKLRVLTGECLPTAGGGALHPFRKVLQELADRCREGGVEATEHLLGARGKVLALVEPALLGLPGQEAHREPAELPAPAARLRLFRCLAETLEAWTEGLGALLILDDLQWADELTLGFLEHAGAAGRAPLLIVGTYRAEEVGEELRRLLERPEALRLELGRLQEREVGSIVSDMLAISPPPSLFVSFLTRHSEGNPFFVAEYLRAALAEGLLYRDGEGYWQVAEKDEDRATAATYEALPLPRSLRELVDRRLSGLSEAALGVVEAAAVLGRESPLALLERVEPRAAAALAELLQRQVLEEAASDRVRFVHDKLREGALARMQQAHASALHRAAATAIEELGLAEEHPGELGRHWEEACEPAKARACYLAAARKAMRIFGHEEVERLYRAYQRLAPEPTPESVAVRNELGEKVLHPRGRNDEAAAEHRRALEEARALGDRRLEGESLTWLGIVYRGIGQGKEAWRLYEQALGISREVGNRHGEGFVLASLATVCTDQGRFEESRRFLEQALVIHRETGNRRSEGIVLGNLGVLDQERGLELYEQALAIHREVGNRRFEGTVLANLGILHTEQGRPSEALRLYEQALLIFREVGDRRFEGITLGEMGNLHRLQGRRDEALRLHEQSLAIHREVGNWRGEAVVLGGLGLLRLEEGRFPEARQLCESSLAVCRDRGDRRFEGVVLGYLARLELLSGGDLAQAVRLAERGEELLEASGDRLELAKLLCVRGHLELACGRSGREFLERARSLSRKTGVEPGSELQGAIAKLESALERQGG